MLILYMCERKGYLVCSCVSVLAHRVHSWPGLTMDSQANCRVNDLGTGNVSCDEQPLMDRGAKCSHSDQRQHFGFRNKDMNCYVPRSLQNHPTNFVDLTVGNLSFSHKFVSVSLGFATATSSADSVLVSHKEEA